MRVTNTMISNRYLSDVNKNLNNMQKITQQMTSGNLVNRPSDDPYITLRSMQIDSSTSSNKQYNSNIKDVYNWLDTTDGALSEINDSIGRIRELMVSSGNIAYDSDQRQTIADEINQKVNEISQILNTSFDGRYLFGGTRVNSTPTSVKTENGNQVLYLASDQTDANGNYLPLNETDNQYKMVQSKLNTEVSRGVTLDYSISATDFLKFDYVELDKATNQMVTKKMDVSTLFKNITDNLVSGNKDDYDKVVNENLDSIDKVVTNLLTLRSEVGAKQNRMDSAKSINEDENLNLTDILSKTMDTDYTQKSIEYSMAQTVYQATLQVSGQILPLTILDYI